MSDWSIPLSDLDYGPEEEAAAVRVLRGKWLSMGPEVQAFEEEFRTQLGVKHAFAVANGTAALHLAYLALGLTPGDEIVQPAINFVAAANMTAAVGATPVFADIIGLDEPTIAPAEIQRLITPRTKAVVVMHYGGSLCRMDEITALCRQRGLALIEDACHAVGAGRAGGWGDVGCFSFFSNKNLATGEGGMVTTNRDDLAEKLRRLRSHGMSSLTWDRHRGHASSYDVTLHGYNYRLDELRAALGRCQLRKLARNNARRGELRRRYHRALAEMPGWVTPFAAQPDPGSAHLMVLVAPDPARRQRVADHLRAAGVQTSLHYPCVPDFAAFERFRPTGLDCSRAYASRVLTLPLYPTLAVEDLDRIVTLIRQVAVD